MSKLSRRGLGPPQDSWSMMARSAALIVKQLIVENSLPLKVVSAVEAPFRLPVIMSKIMASVVSSISSESSNGYHSWQDPGFFTAHDLVAPHSSINLFLPSSHRWKDLSFVDTFVPRMA